MPIIKQVLSMIKAVMDGEILNHSSNNSDAPKTPPSVTLQREWMLKRPNERITMPKKIDKYL